MGLKLMLTEPEVRHPEINRLVIELVGGSEPYLWIGNAETPQWCFGTVTVQKLLVMLRRHNYSLADDGLTLLHKGARLNGSGD